jgi:hypothetical protein
VFVFFVAAGFCTAGAIVGAIVGFFLDVKGSGASVAGIVAGAGATQAFLRSRGIVPPKKKGN